MWRAFGIWDKSALYTDKSRNEMTLLRKYFPTNLVYAFTLRVTGIKNGMFNEWFYNSKLKAISVVRKTPAGRQCRWKLTPYPSCCSLLWDFTDTDQYHNRANPQKNECAEEDSLENRSGNELAEWEFAPYMDILRACLRKESKFWSEEFGNVVPIKVSF